MQYVGIFGISLCAQNATEVVLFFLFYWCCAVLKDCMKESCWNALYLKGMENQLVPLPHQALAVIFTILRFPWCVLRMTTVR